MDGEKITQFGHSNVSRALPLHSKPVFCFSNQINPLSASLILRNYKFEEQEIVASPIKDKNERITVETISQLIIENTTDNTHIEIKEEIKTTKIIEERQDEFTDRKKLSKTENRTKKSPIDITFTHPLATFADTTENLPKKGFFANNDSYLEGMDDIEEVDELELDDLDEIIDVNQINEPEEKEDKKEVSEDENITSNTSFDSKAALEVDIFGFYIQKSKELGIINKCPSSYDPNHEKVLIRTWDHWISLQSNSFQTSSNTPQKSTNTSSDWMISDTFILDLVKTHAIPHSIRPKVWKYLAASSKDQTTETRRRLLTCTEEGSDGQKIYNDLLSRGPVNECSNQIKLDIFRTFSSHSLYVEENGNGQQRLFNVLLAYSYWNPHIGYCQGMSFVGAALLMFMSEVETFWLLDWMFSEKRSGDYYIHSMKGILNDSQLLDSLIRLVYPLLHSHLSGQGIHPLMYSTPWFMTIFTHLPSWYTILRIFDYFFIEGPAAILRFSLAILHVCQESLLDIEKLDLILPLLQNISIDKCKEEVLLPIARSIPIHHYIRHHKSLQPPTPQQQTAPVTRSTSQKQLRTSTGNSSNNHSNNNNAIVQSSTKVPPPNNLKVFLRNFGLLFLLPANQKSLLIVTIILHLLINQIIIIIIKIVIKLIALLLRIMLIITHEIIILITIIARKREKLEKMKKMFWFMN